MDTLYLDTRRTVDAGRGHGRRECFVQSEAEREAHSACSVQRVLVDGRLSLSTGAEIETALCILESAPYVRIKP